MAGWDALLGLGVLTLFAAVGLGFGPFGLGLVLLALLGAVGGVVASRGQRFNFAPSTSSELLQGGVHHRESMVHHKESLVRELMPYAVGALLLRLFVVAMVNGTSLWRVFGGDAITWEARGKMVLSLLSSQPLYTDGSASRYLAFYPVLNAASYWLLGSTRIPLSIVNAFVGVGVAALASRLAYTLYGREVARRCFLLVAFYPSMILWSSMNLRDVWAHALILALITAGIRVRERVSPLGALWIVALLLMLYTVRPYLLALFVLALGTSLLVVRPSQVPYAALLLLALGIFANVYSEQIGLIDVPIEHHLEHIQQMREGLAYGGSAYGGDADTRTIGKALAYLPIGFIRFLFAPFPWDIRTFQQAMAFPESAAFMVLTFQAIRTVLRGLVTEPSRIALPVSAILIVAMAYSLVSGNEGTAFRHRAQVVVVVLVFSACHQIRVRHRKQLERQRALEAGYLQGAVSSAR